MGSCFTEAVCQGLSPLGVAPQQKPLLLSSIPAGRSSDAPWSEPLLTLCSPVVDRPGAGRDRGQPGRRTLLQPLPPWTLQHPLEMPPLQPPAVCGLRSRGGCEEGQGQSR